MTSAHSTTRALAFVKKAIAAVQQELDLHADGKGTVSNTSQLTHFLDMLQIMKQELDAGKPTDRRAGIGHAVTDSWPLGHPLGEILLGAEQEYHAASARCR